MHYNKALCDAHFMGQVDEVDWGSYRSYLCQWREDTTAQTPTMSCGEVVPLDNVKLPDGSVVEACEVSPYDIESVCPQIRDTRAKVVQADVNNDGIVDTSEVGDLMSAEGNNPTETELSLMIGNGMTIDEFVTLMLDQVADAADQSVKQVDSDTQEESFWSSFECDVLDEVYCPVSGEMCTGNVCCPGVSESGGLAFPCPSADSSWCKCSNRTKLQDCTITQSDSSATCGGECELDYCEMMADEFKGWQMACEIEPTWCGGCKACCSLAR